MTGALGRLFAAVDRWTDWKRSWLITAAIACWVLIFVAIWVVYSATHVMDRYQQSAPGAGATYQNQTFRATDIRQTEVILDGEDEVPSSANTTWVVVDVEVTLEKKVETAYCDMPLVAAGERTWDAETFYSRDVATWCDTEEMTVGKPYLVQLIYQVPVKYVDQVYGVGVDDPTSPAPMVVLRP